jgi:hypothetical protein
MPSVSETTGAKGQLAAGLADGVETISENQTVHFVKYLKLVLPIDGYVFWLRSDLVGPSAAFNAASFNSTFFNQPYRPLHSQASFDASGSMHYSTDTFQNEDDSPSINHMIFTSLEPLDDLNDVSPQVMYIGEFDGLKFVFSSRAKFYKQADLYHYRGDAIYPTMLPQIIDDPASLDTRNVIVSNSLPIWLQLNQIMPMYPSFLVPDNLAPPYGVVHIMPEGSRALQAAPFMDKLGSHYQLVVDKVRITIYGLRNFNAMDWVDYVNQHTLDSDDMGIMNMPTIRDEHRNQNELNVIAQKKSIEYEVNYYQTRARTIARKFILSCIPTFNIGP